LGFAGKVGFEIKRITDESKERAGVGKGKKAVGRFAGIGLGKPLLHQRACGGKNEIGKTDADGEQGEDLESGVFGGARFP